MWCLLVSAQSAGFLPCVNNFIAGENLVFGLQVTHYNPYNETVRVELTTILLSDPPRVIFAIEDPALYSFVCETNRDKFMFIGAFPISPLQLYALLMPLGMAAIKPQAKLTFVNVGTQAKLMQALAG
jgi:hypothetical protein